MSNLEEEVKGFCSLEEMWAKIWILFQRNKEKEKQIIKTEGINEIKKESYI